jgi:hypothetical protein
LLKAQKFSLQANSKTNEGGDHPDRDAQFSHINQSVTTALAAQQPVISVDTKKKELVGDFKNAGREWRPQGEPEAVRVHDFLIKELGRAVPYGIYDLAANAGWVSVGMNHDTAAFAVQSIRRWWQDIGCKRYPAAKRLTITCDGGGSNGSRVRLWKLELQKLASQLDIDITVHHLPPGTSKWNKIEHRLFSFITMNWRAKPLVSYRVIVDLISATTTDTGLTVRCELDTGRYPKGIAVTDQEMAEITIPSSRQYPKILWRDDAEVVGDLIAVEAPVPGHLLAQERQDCVAEVSESFVARVMGDVPVHQAPKSFDRVEVRAVGRDEV